MNGYKRNQNTTLTQELIEVGCALAISLMILGCVI